MPIVQIEKESIRQDPSSTFRSRENIISTQPSAKTLPGLSGDRGGHGQVLSSTNTELVLASLVARVFQADTEGKESKQMTAPLSQDSQHLASVGFLRQVPFSDSSS